MYLSILVVIFIFSKTQCLLPVVKVEGDVNIVLLLDNCLNNNSEVIPFRKQSLLSTALWTIERIQYLEHLSPIKLGIEAYEICTENDFLKTIFDLYEIDNTYNLGVITEKKPNAMQLKFCDLLDIRTITVRHLNSLLIKASIQFLIAIGWTENVTIFAPNKSIMDEFYKLSKSEYICIKECIVYEDTCGHVLNYSNPVVFFGSLYQIEDFARSKNMENFNEEIHALFVPLDGSVPEDLPYDSFVIIPPHNPAAKTYKLTENILPSPQFLYTAMSILTFTKNIELFVEKSCNETIYKVNCLRYKFNKRYKPVLMTPTSILESLKLEPLKSNFVYDIYKVDNDTKNITAWGIKNNFLKPMSKIFSYNIFFDNLTLINKFNIEMNNVSRMDRKENNTKCLKYFEKKHVNILIGVISYLSFRSEAWVYAFLSLSLLGVVVCISILIFILLSICRRDILEGNPVLTLSLLVSIMILFCSVLPFSIEDNIDTSNPLCLTKSLSITLGYAAVFSLVLSRCILLATASKEIGFMSHIAGPVQAFLCLFIFGVQAALSLQVIGKCLEIFCNTAFIYIMSYNIMLLALLLCLCPLIYKCERNYREGKYFSIAIILIAIIWTTWLLLYVFLDKTWNEPMLCLGLVGTAGAFLGAVFIPRTYLMTVASARNKLTSSFPSLNTSNSIADIYRSNTQPIYDCVNVAAINAVNVARAGVTLPSPQTMQQPDLYSFPALPDDEDLDFRCDTPTQNDKITRF